MWLKCIREAWLEFLAILTIKKKAFHEQSNVRAHSPTFLLLLLLSCETTKYNYCCCHHWIEIWIPTFWKHKIMCLLLLFGLSACLPKFCRLVGWRKGRRVGKQVSFPESITVRRSCIKKSLVIVFIISNTRRYCLLWDVHIYLMSIVENKHANHHQMKCLAAAKHQKELG